MTRVGRSFYLLAYVAVDEADRVRDVAELDRLRDAIEVGIQELHPGWIVDTVFVVDRKRLQSG